MAVPAAFSEEALYGGRLTPLMIGVTGHRDLVEAEVPEIRLRIEALLVLLQRRCPDRPLRILSALAEAADRVVAEVALKLGVDVTAVLPMPADLYKCDFADLHSMEQFDRLRERAVEVLELAIISEHSHEELTEAGEARNLQYARLGIFLCAHSHVLLALWDRKSSDDLGRTAQVVRFHHHDIMEGFSAADEINPQILADDASDLVYQIVVSRRRENGQPRAGLKPLYTPTLPERYATIFERTNEFNHDVKRFARRICAECSRDSVAPRAPAGREPGLAYARLKRAASRHRAPIRLAFGAGRSNRFANAGHACRTRRPARTPAPGLYTHRFCRLQNTVMNTKEPSANLRQDGTRRICD